MRTKFANFCRETGGEAVLSYTLMVGAFIVAFIGMASAVQVALEMQFERIADNVATGRPVTMAAINPGDGGSSGGGSSGGGSAGGGSAGGGSSGGGSSGGGSSGGGSAGGGSSGGGSPGGGSSGGGSSGGGSSGGGSSGSGNGKKP